MNWPTCLTDETRSAVTVNVASRADLLADLRARLENRQGFTLATLNLDHVVKLRRQPDFAAAYLRHSHVTADGNPIRWLEGLAGRQIDLVTGSDLIDPLVALAAELGVPIALLGSTEEALQAAAEALSRRYPDLKVAALIAPAMGFDPTGADADACLTRLGASGAGLCFLALGAPKQERFAAYAQEILPHMGFVSIGAGLDFIAGRQRRAPRIVRRLAAEWLWRLVHDPRRMGRRYAECFAVLPGLVGVALKSRRAGLPEEEPR